MMMKLINEKIFQKQLTPQVLNQVSGQNDDTRHM